MQRIEEKKINSFWSRRATYVIVIFSDATDIWWLRFLRPGFRHCFAVVFDGRQWILLDPLSHRIDIVAGDYMDRLEIVEWYRRLGCNVVETRLNAAPNAVPFPEPLTCVSIVKRLIGIRRPFVWTPWQLFRAIGEKSS